MAEKRYSTSEIMELLPWPHNFVALVNGDDEGPRPVDYQLTQDHLDGIAFALDTIPDKDREIVLAYCRDSLTHREIGEKYGCTAANIQRIFQKTIKRMQVPSRLSNILYGRQYVIECDEQRIRQLKLEKKKQYLDEYEQKLEKRLADLEDLERLIDDHELSVQEQLDKTGMLAVVKPEDVTVEEMDLSVRAFSALKRAGCDTVADVIELVKAGRLKKVAGMGPHSSMEVLHKLHKATGLDFSSMY